jgi:hypothetical protein
VLWRLRLRTISGLFICGALSHAAGSARADCLGLDCVDLDQDCVCDHEDCLLESPQKHCEGALLISPEAGSIPYSCENEDYACKRIGSTTCGQECGSKSCGYDCFPCDTTDECERPRVCNSAHRCVPLEEALAQEEEEDDERGCSMPPGGGGGLSLCALAAGAALVLALRRHRQKR